MFEVIKMFKKPYYIPKHAIDMFRERVDKNLTNSQIRFIIQERIQFSLPVAYQHHNNEFQPVYEAEYNNKKFCPCTLR